MFSRKEVDLGFISCPCFTNLLTFYFLKGAIKIMFNFTPPHYFHIPVYYHNDSHVRFVLSTDWALQAGMIHILGDSDESKKLSHFPHCPKLIFLHG